MALFTAWHVAAFSQRAKAGKLEDWAHYRAKVSGAPREAPPTRVSWQARKAQRQRQVDVMKKHQQQRQAPPRPRG